MTEYALPTPISTDGPPVNVPLLRKAVEWAEADVLKPEAEREWYQQMWFKQADAIGRTCGTTGCIAGHTLLIVGAEPYFLDNDPETADAILADGRRVSVPVEAERVLGLTGDEATGLFHAGNTIEEVRTIAERIAARAGERL